MNPSTLISAHCYAGDEAQVRMLLPVYEHHAAPLVVISPIDSPVREMNQHICRHAGKRAYIGQDSLDRQIAHLQILLEYPFQYYLLNDSDSFCVSAEIPQRLYLQGEDTLWSNQVTDPRPHESPYPKLACQPPYFLTRRSIERILEVAPRIKAHAVTPYIDWAMLAWGCEAGLKHRAFAELEHPAAFEFGGGDPWDTLRFRISQMGSVMCHPIKTEQQRDLCIDARKIYERR